MTPAQPTMMIVPRDSNLEVEAMISNQDIGFVEAGQDAAIKIDTFNFTRYGLITGKVISISQDAIPRNKPPENGNAKSFGAGTTSSEPTGQELVYAARVSLDRNYMNIENKHVSFSPGMATTVEIKSGSRSIISYLLSPIMRYKQEACGSANFRARALRPNIGRATAVDVSRMTMCRVRSAAASSERDGRSRSRRRRQGPSRQRREADHADPASATEHLEGTSALEDRQRKNARCATR